MAPIFWHWPTVTFEHGPFTSIVLCFIFAVGYVASLYVGTSRTQRRDHPDTIRNRFMRVSIVCTLVIPVLWLCSTRSHSMRARSLFTWVGLRWEGLLLSSILPLLLTMVLFLGPLTLHYIDGIFLIYKDPQYWKNNFKNLIWLRNHIVAPLSEEFIFRTCMLPLLAPALGSTTAMFICPLFFGVAHFHHLSEKIREGVNPQMAVFQSVFQFGYTTVFGIYSAFLFLRTGHFAAPVVAHAFCNHMGFPDFKDVLQHKPPRRYAIMAVFVVGLLVWCKLLYPLTEPSFYSNDLYWV